MTQKRLRSKGYPAAPAADGDGAAAHGSSVVLLDHLSADYARTVPAVRATPKSLRSLVERGYSQEEIHSYVVPKRTLARRQARSEPLSIEETDKALRLERIAELAAGAFGDPTKANRWLRKSKRQLNGETPLAFLGSEAGARVVEDMLRRIEHGILA